MPRGTERRGASLVELLVVMGIISIMIGMLMPALHRARDMARKTGCQNNLHQLGIAYRHYSDSHRREPRTNNGSGPGGWAIDILPYLEQKALLNQIRFSEPVTSAKNIEAALFRPRVYICPSASRVESRIAGIPALNYMAVVEFIEPPGTRPFRFNPQKRRIGFFQDVPYGEKSPWMLSPEITLGDSRLLIDEAKGPHVNGTYLRN